MIATGISGQSGGSSQNGIEIRPSPIRPASATTPFHTLPAMPPPCLRASCGKRRDATCSTIAGMPNTLRISSAVSQTSGTNIRNTRTFAASAIAPPMSQRMKKVPLWTHSCIQPASAATTCAPANQSTVPQTASAMSIGQIISQSMRG